MNGFGGNVAAMRRLLLLALLACACSVPVQHGLDEPAANEVLSALERAGIGASKTRDEASGVENGFVVRVAGSDGSRALELLRSLGLPRSRRSGLAELYGQPSLVPTATEERARFLEALGSEIERTLETIDGVVSARVHLVLAESDPLAGDARPRVPAQAAVLLKLRAGGAAAIKEGDVRKLVAGSVPGLEPASVAVVVTAAPEWSGAAPALVALGPVRVAPGSRGVLLGTLGALTGTVAVLALVLLFLARRLAATQRALDDRQA
jgi:type III secretion protein J